MSKHQNLELFKKPMLAYGGELRKKAKNRQSRPLVFRSGSMHMTMRSTKAIGKNSFQNPQNKKRIEAYIYSFSAKKGVKILSFANVGNHIHLHIQLTNLRLYKAWIRGLTSGLAMISMGLKGLKKLKENKQKFWDQRPFSRVIQSFRHFMNTKSYLEINILEGMGMPRIQAELLIHGSRKYFRSS